MKRFLAPLGSIILIGGTLAVAPAQSADRDADGDSSATAGATRVRCVEARVKDPHLQQLTPIT